MDYRTTVLIPSKKIVTASFPSTSRRQKSVISVLHRPETKRADTIGCIFVQFSALELSISGESSPYYPDVLMISNPQPFVR